MERLKIVGKTWIISILSCLILYFLVVLISNLWIRPAFDIWTKHECVELVQVRIIIWSLIIIIFGFIKYRIQTISLLKTIFKSILFGLQFFVCFSLLVWVMDYIGRWNAFDVENYPPAYDFILLNYLMPFICFIYFTRYYFNLKKHRKVKDKNISLD